MDSHVQAASDPSAGSAETAAYPDAPAETQRHPSNTLSPSSQPKDVHMTEQKSRTMRTDNAQQAPGQTNGPQNGGPSPEKKDKSSSTKGWKDHLKRPLAPLVKPLPPWLEGYIWGWIGGFVGVGLVMIIMTRATAFTSSSDVPQGAWTAPVITGSFGASAVLIYAVPASPLSQPRSFFFGQTFSSLVGVIITKLFALNSHFDINNTNHSSSLVWVAGSFATATSILVMQITRTIHPPGGATAVLAATSPQIIRLGWRFIPIVMLSSAVMLVWACIWMNMGRKSYPDWWLIPPESIRQSFAPGPGLAPIVRRLKPKKRKQGGKRNKGILPTNKDNLNRQSQSEWRDED
ncbi:unnamed protein product [Sympodiomycopsis kandeliae]